MLLDLRHWEMLIALADRGSLHAAAEELGLSQSALSHRLAEAERRLGSALVTRQGRGIELTPWGRQMVRTGRQALRSLARAESDFITAGRFQESARRASHVIRLGVAYYDSFHWLPAFRKEAPLPDGWKFEVSRRAALDPLPSLAQSQVDIVLSPSALENDDVQAETLFEDELVLVTPLGHPLAGRDDITPADLMEAEYLTYSFQVQPGFEYEKFFQPAGLFPASSTVVENIPAILELIAGGMGVSIMSRWAVRHAARRNAVVLTGLPQALAIRWHALTRREDSARSATGDCVSILRDWFKSTT